MIRLTIDAEAAAPPFAQLCDQIRAQVETGALRPGERLSPVRQLAAELGIAPNTVARAYRELEAEGLLEGRGRTGTFIADDDHHRAAKAAAKTFAETAASLGLRPEEALAVVRRALGV